MIRSRLGYAKPAVKPNRWKKSCCRTITGVLARLMRCGPMCAAKIGKGALDEGGEYWYCTLIENRSRFRIGRGIGRTEGEAAQRIWRYWRWTLGVHRPPPLVSDGWGGHHDAL